MFYTCEFIIYKRRIFYLILILLLLFILGENPMGLCGKLLYYVYLKEFFGKEIYAFFAS